VSAFAVTFFQDYAARRKTEESLTLEALAERIRATAVPTKELLPWLKLARFGMIPRPRLDGTTSGSLRWDGNVTKLSGVVGESDAEEMTPEEAAERLDKAGIDAVVYTSPSHLLNGHGPRWRAVCPFSEELPPDRHYQMMARLNGLLGGVLSVESFTLSQSYYFGAVNGNPEHRALIVDGTATIDRCDELDESAVGKPNGADGCAKPNGQPQASIDDIRAALEVIPNPIPSWKLSQTGPSWKQWCDFGLALYASCGGSDEGLEAFHTWSAKSSKYDKGETEFHWSKFHRSPPTRSGFGTLVHLARETQPGWVPPSRRPRTLPLITVAAGKRHVAADKGIGALVSAGVAFYQRNRAIVRIARVKAKTSSGETIWIPGIVPVPPPLMERELGRSADWRKWDARKKDYVAIDPPGAVAAQILSMVGEWPFEPLHGIIQCPTLRRDGSLLDKPGYDERTGLVLVDGIKMPPISPNVRQEDAEEALTLLLGLLTEFPFDDGTDELSKAMSKSVALSMFITPVIRGAMDVAPMHLVTKPLPGTGASYLVDCAAMIATGERCPVQAMAPKYEETEKRLVAAALSGFPLIGIDNVREIVAGDFFCQIVERALMRLRALGSSDDHRIPNSFTTFANGNNAIVAEDMVRRTVRCGMDANIEHPEQRKFDFDPLAAIQRDRGKYIAACLKITLAYINEGRPEPQTPLPSFGEWSRLVREPLIWLGCADPVASQEKLRSADPRKANLAEVFDAWREVLGIGNQYRTGEIIAAATDGSALRAALLDVAKRRAKTEEPEIDNNVLGKWLRNHEGHIAAGLKLQADRADRARPKWSLRSVHGL
jgi:putative DNA primase/helicase